MVNLYAPNDGKEEMKYLDKLHPVLGNYTEENLLAFGDVNSVMSKELDIMSGRQHCQREVDKLKETVGKLALMCGDQCMTKKKKILGVNTIYLLLDVSTSALLMETLHSFVYRVIFCP